MIKKVVNYYYFIYSHNFKRSLVFTYLCACSVYRTVSQVRLQTLEYANIFYKHNILQLPLGGCITWVSTVYFKQGLLAAIMAEQFHPSLCLK